MKSFGEFVDKKTRETKKQLGIVQKILEHDGLKIRQHFDNHDPFLYVEDPGKQLSFKGIRIYRIGESISFRVQKEEKTHPYGRAYPLDIEGMYKDLTSDDMSEGEAGKEVMKAVTKEIRNFFVKSAEAEKDLRAGEFDRNNITMASDQGTDYSSMIGKNNYLQ